MIATIEYIDNKFVVVIDNVIYPIVYDLNKATTLYSTPANTNYKTWTAKKSKRNYARPDLVSVYWSPFKPGLKIIGAINGSNFIKQYNI